jgi:CDP-4-dehydro-6-deoxyglucose reductase
MALDTAEQIHLYWITTAGNGHYLGNLCRSWSDALDNFHYTPLTASDERPLEVLLAEITAGLEDLQNLDFYACVPPAQLAAAQARLLEQGVLPGHLRLEPLRLEPAD